MKKIIICFIIIFSIFLTSCMKEANETQPPTDTQPPSETQTPNETQTPSETQTPRETQKPSETQDTPKNNNHKILDGYERIYLTVENGKIILPEANITKAVFASGNKELSQEDVSKLQDFLKNVNSLEETINGFDLMNYAGHIEYIIIYFEDGTYCVTVVYDRDTEEYTKNKLHIIFGAKVLDMTYRVKDDEQWNALAEILSSYVLKPRPPLVTSR